MILRFFPTLTVLCRRRCSELHKENHLAILLPWSSHLILPLLIKIMFETKTFIASYLYGNCIQDMIVLFLALFLFLNEQVKPQHYFIWLWKQKYRLKRAMQMFFISFSYFLATGLPLIISMEHKGHICCATIPECRAAGQR